jgi:hypothetical protein
MQALFEVKGRSFINEKLIDIGMIFVSPIPGAPASQSEIHLIYSLDGGGTWIDPVTLVPATRAEPQHAHPAIALAGAGTNVIATVGYYTQLARAKVRVDSISALIHTKGHAGSLSAPHREPLGPTFDLTPSNIPLPAFGPHFTTNYYRTFVPCYDIGEYTAAIPAGHQQTFLAWGDNRNQRTTPPESPAIG